LDFRKIFAKEKSDESEEQPQSRTVIRRCARLIFEDLPRARKPNRNSYSQSLEIAIAKETAVRGLFV
jgi:hypothetical protein